MSALEVIEAFKPQIKRALDKSPDGGTYREVESAVLEGSAHPWGGKESVVITEMVTALNVWLFAGTLEENKEMAVSVIAHAKVLGIDQMTVTNPRPGWAKHLEALGFEKQTVYVKGLKDGR